MRTVVEIQAAIERNKTDYEDCRKYFGAMWDCDIQASLFRQSSNAHLETLRAELAAAQQGGE